MMDSLSFVLRMGSQKLAESDSFRFPGKHCSPRKHLVALNASAYPFSPIKDHGHAFHWSDL